MRYWSSTHVWNHGWRPPFGLQQADQFVEGNVRVDQLPRTVNDKVDRAALKSIGGGVVPQPDADREADSENPVEAMIADVWKRALGLTELSVTDDYFQLGEHGLSRT